MLKNKGMTSFCCSAFIMSSTTFNYEPLKTSQPWLAVTPARGVGGGGVGGSWEFLVGVCRLVLQILTLL